MKKKKKIPPDQLRQNCSAENEIGSNVINKREQQGTSVRAHNALAAERHSINDCHGGAAGTAGEEGRARAPPAPSLVALGPQRAPSPRLALPRRPHYRRKQVMLRLRLFLPPFLGAHISSSFSCRTSVLALPSLHASIASRRRPCASFPPSLRSLCILNVPLSRNLSAVELAVLDPVPCLTASSAASVSPPP